MRLSVEGFRETIGMDCFKKNKKACEKETQKKRNSKRKGKDRKRNEANLRHDASNNEHSALVLYQLLDGSVQNVGDELQELGAMPDLQSFQDHKQALRNLSTLQATRTNNAETLTFSPALRICPLETPEVTVQESYVPLAEKEANTMITSVQPKKRNEPTGHLQVFTLCIVITGCLRSACTHIDGPWTCTPRFIDSFAKQWIPVPFAGNAVTCHLEGSAAMCHSNVVP